MSSVAKVVGMQAKLIAADDITSKRKSTQTFITCTMQMTICQKKTYDWVIKPIKNIQTSKSAYVQYPKE